MRRSLSLVTCRLGSTASQVVHPIPSMMQIPLKRIPPATPDTQDGSNPQHAESLKLLIENCQPSILSASSKSKIQQLKDSISKVKAHRELVPDFCSVYLRNLKKGDSYDSFVKHFPELTASSTAWFNSPAAFYLSFIRCDLQSAKSNARKLEGEHKEFSRLCLLSLAEAKQSLSEVTYMEDKEPSAQPAIDIGVAMRGDVEKLLERIDAVDQNSKVTTILRGYVTLVENGHSSEAAQLLNSSLAPVRAMLPTVPNLNMLKCVVDYLRVNEFQSAASQLERSFKLDAIENTVNFRRIFGRPAKLPKAVIKGSPPLIFPPTKTAKNRRKHHKN